MDWNQIEQKWDEMAHRVQPQSSLPFKSRLKPSLDEPKLLSTIDPLTHLGLTG